MYSETRPFPPLELTVPAWEKHVVSRGDQLRTAGPVSMSHSWWIMPGSRIVQFGIKRFGEIPNTGVEEDYRELKIWCSPEADFIIGYYDEETEELVQPGPVNQDVRLRTGRSVLVLTYANDANLPGNGLPLVMRDHLPTGARLLMAKIPDRVVQSFTGLREDAAE